jgi:conjugal transfer pilus assembly protein TraF
MHRLAAVALLLVMTSAQAQPRFWGDTWRGWHFYEPEAQTLPDQPPEPARAASAPATKRAPELLAFERLQKQLEETRAIAIMRPTEANVRRYMTLEASVVAQASTFADVAQRVAWSTPALDPTLQGRPVNARALEVFEQQQSEDRARSVAALGRDHVLLFFFRSDCPYCHAYAPLLASFEARHGLHVEAVSIDGGPLPGFGSARRDNGIAQALQVTQVPAVYLAQPFTGRIAPIGFGVLSEAQLLERIATLADVDSAATPGTTNVSSLP